MLNHTTCSIGPIILMSAVLLAVTAACSDSATTATEPDTTAAEPDTGGDMSTPATDTGVDGDGDDGDLEPEELGCTSSDPDCVDWRFVTDDDGRALILHGLNIDGAAKHNEGLPTITEEEIVQVAHEWGFNLGACRA